MKKITSFTVDHDKILPGMYISRIDGDVTTFDLRTRRPNMGDYMDTRTMHSVEHMLATYLRNGEIGQNVIYFGPMGCQTGFYFLFDENTLSCAEAVALLKDVFSKAADFDGPMPGMSEIECGNYRNLDISLAKSCCGFYADVINHWTEEKLAY